MSTMKKYLFVFLKTGGGHFAPARAISNFMNKNYSDIAEPRLIYGFEKSPRWVQFIIEDGYGILQYTGRWFFEFLYALHKIPIIAIATSNLVSLFMRKYLETEIIKEKPDKIVIFHFFCIKPILKILKMNKLSSPVQVLVTDPFSPHPLWFQAKQLNFIVFSHELESKINKMRKGHSIRCFNFPVDDKFSKTLSENEVVSTKKASEYNPAKKMVLILGGGDGIPKGKKLLRELLKANITAEIGIVCGKNGVLKKEAEKLKKIHKADNLKIYSYVDIIYELINIADVVITKCGASTTMEILNLKKVPIVIDYIWEQEQGNVDFIINKKLGIYEPQVDKLPKVIKSLIEDQKLNGVYKGNIVKEKINNGVKEVTEYLILNSK